MPSTFTNLLFVKKTNKQKSTNRKHETRSDMSMTGNISGLSFSVTN